MRTRKRSAWACLLLIGLCAGAVSGAQPSVTAITGATLVTGLDAPAQPGMTVTIRDGRFASVERNGPVPRGARVIDGRGMFLIPGLWDMHVHFTLASDLAAPLMLASGVTGARDMGGDLAVVDWLRARIERGDVEGPRIWRAGPFVDGSKPGTANRLVIASAGDAVQAVRLLKDHGVDFIKVHNGTPREPYFALLEEAARIGMRVAGHIPLDVDPAQAIASGHDSVEHIVSLFEGPVAQKVRRGATEEQAIAEFTDADARSLARRMAARGVWFDPTLVAYWRRSFRSEPSIRDDPRQRYLAASLTREWKNAGPPDDPAVRARLAAGWKRFREIARIFHNEGVRMLAGTDTGARLVLPGCDLHEELRILVEEAGLTPLQAIQAATRNSAESVGRLHDLGTIEAGKLADLVMLEDNPLEDIRATRSVAAVIAAGRVYTRAHLDALLARIERLAPAR